MYDHLIKSHDQYTIEEGYETPQWSSSQPLFLNIVDKTQYGDIDLLPVINCYDIYYKHQLPREAACFMHPNDYVVLESILPGRVTTVVTSISAVRGVLWVSKRSECLFENNNGGSSRG